MQLMTRPLVVKINGIPIKVPRPKRRQVPGAQALLSDSAAAPAGGDPAAPLSSVHAEVTFVAAQQREQPTSAGAIGDKPRRGMSLREMYRTVLDEFIPPHLEQFKPFLELAYVTGTWREALVRASIIEAIAGNSQMLHQVISRVEPLNTSIVIGKQSVSEVMRDNGLEAEAVQAKAAELALRLASGELQLPGFSVEPASVKQLEEPTAEVSPSTGSPVAGDTAQLDLSEPEFPGSAPTLEGSDGQPLAEPGRPGDPAAGVG